MAPWKTKGEKVSKNYLIVSLDADTQHTQQNLTTGKPVTILRESKSAKRLGLVCTELEEKR